MTEADEGTVPVFESPLCLEVDQQATYPSPNYDSGFDESVNTLEAFLSTGAESNMDFTELNNAEDDLGMGCLAFDELLDINYPSIPDGFNAEMKEFVQDSSSNDREISLVEHSNELGSVLLSIPDRKMKPDKCAFEDTLKTVASANDENKNSRVVVLNRRDGSSRVLNIVPVKQPKVESTVALPLNGFKEPRRSARTIRCSRDAPPNRNKSVMYPDEDETDKSRKNAIQAKINREKKKAYIAELEKNVSELSKENSTLKRRNEKLSNDKNSLSEEVEYLRSIIANQSALSRLLDNITDVKGVSLSTSFINDRQKRIYDGDHDYVQPAKSMRIASKVPGGVCLHVENDNVSLEFCSSCARMAKERRFEE